MRHPPELDSATPPHFHNLPAGQAPKTHTAAATDQGSRLTSWQKHQQALQHLRHNTSCAQLSRKPQHLRHQMLSQHHPSDTKQTFIAYASHPNPSRNGPHRTVCIHVHHAHHTPCHPIIPAEGGGVTWQAAPEVPPQARSCCMVHSWHIHITTPSNKHECMSTHALPLATHPRPPPLHPLHILALGSMAVSFVPLLLQPLQVAQPVL